MSNLQSMTPANTLDLLGRTCPYPIVLTKKEMEKLPSGSLLKLLSDSEVTVHETIPRYCEKNGYEFETARLEDEGYWEIFILKK